jgi:hypothetical protein
LKKQIQINQPNIVGEKSSSDAKMLNVFLINYPSLTNYSIEKDDRVNHVSKKDIVRGRCSFCLPYSAKWQEKPQWSDISAVSQISRHLIDENRTGQSGGEESWLS